MKKNNKNLALALGFFDGVHLGHGALFEKVMAHPSESAVLTFDCHPSQILGDTVTPLLTSIEDKKYLISEKYKIQKIIVADFSEIYHLNWYEFIDSYLQKTLSVTHIVAGHDFRFGARGEGDVTKLKNTCYDLGISCDIISAVSLKKQIISSTHIRNLIQKGDMIKAQQFLGHPHILSNKVQHGNKLGSTVLGFPTVNLSVPENVIVPAFGVYACQIWVGSQMFRAVTNVGIRPTVEETNKEVTIEGFLLDFPDGNLYGQILRVEFYHYLRNEIKFNNFDALKIQIAKDVQATKNFFLIS